MHFPKIKDFILQNRLNSSSKIKKKGRKQRLEEHQKVVILYLCCLLKIILVSSSMRSPHPLPPTHTFSLPFSLSLSDLNLSLIKQNHVMPTVIVIWVREGRNLGLLKNHSVDSWISSDGIQPLVHLRWLHQASPFLFLGSIN